MVPDQSLNKRACPGSVHASSSFAWPSCVVTLGCHTPLVVMIESLPPSPLRALVRAFAKPIHKWREKRRFKRESRSNVFHYIYATNKWGCDESRSGKGSDMAQTSELRDHLPNALEHLEVESILDLPCGDMHWMQTLDLSGYRYIGADIVPDLIEHNRNNHPNLRFDVLDICADKLPKVDLMLSRDLFVHLSFHDIGLALANVRNSQIAYLACTTFPGITSNQDKLTGNHRQLNMSIAPMEFGEPLIALADGTRHDESGVPEKFLGIWRVANLPVSLVTAVAPTQRDQS